MDNRIFDASASPNPPQAPANPSQGYPTNGNPATNTPATTPGAYWLYQIGEELRNAIVMLGATPDSTETNQLAQGLATLKNLVLAASIPTGVLWPFTGSTIPTGFLYANGAAVSRTAFAGLFGLFGTTYGAGDGATTFNLPDTRGIVLRGLDNGRGLDVGRLLGSYQADMFASHVHGVVDPSHAHAAYDPGHVHSLFDPGHEHTMPTANSGGSPPAMVNASYIGGNGGNFPTSASGTGISVAGAATNIGIYGAGTGISISAAGGAETRVKNLAVNFIIKY